MWSMKGQKKLLEFLADMGWVELGQSQLGLCNAWIPVGNALWELSVQWQFEGRMIHKSRVNHYRARLH